MPRTRCGRPPVGVGLSGTSWPRRACRDGGFPSSALKDSRSRLPGESGCSRFARVQVDGRHPTSARKPRCLVMHTGSSVAQTMLKHTRFQHVSDTPVPRPLHPSGRLPTFRAGGTPGTNGGPDDTAQPASRSHLARAFREHASTVAGQLGAITMQPTFTHHDRAQGVQTAGGPGQCRGAEFGPETLTSLPRQVRRGSSMLASSRGGGVARGRQAELRRRRQVVGESGI